MEKLKGNYNFEQTSGLLTFIGRKASYGLYNGEPSVFIGEEPLPESFELPESYDSNFYLSNKFNMYVLGEADENTKSVIELFDEVRKSRYDMDTVKFARVSLIDEDTKNNSKFFKVTFNGTLYYALYTATKSYEKRKTKRR